MSEFIVSARKYRPSTFASVVGQQSITSTLKNAIERGQLAHAYLFCGPRGVGKTTCARIFAKAINCLNPNGAEACNECESCRAFNEGRSLNIHELDAASNNSVDDIRSLIEQVRIMPQIGKYSLFIIDEVHMLSQQAFNAFLKTLEEPPKHAVFILATTEKHKIIPTILSRCQVYDFNRIRVEDSVHYLKHIADNEGVTYDEESLNLIAQKADGGMRDALSMFDKAVSFCNANLQYRAVADTLNVLDYDTYFSMTELLMAGDYVSALLRFDEVLSKGFSGQTFMAGLNQHMRDLLLAKGPAISLIELTGTLLERYRNQAAQCPEEFLFGAIALLTEADGKIKQSSNQRLLVELGLMKIAGLGKKKNNDRAIEGVAGTIGVGGIKVAESLGFGVENYSLPDLPDKITPTANSATISATPTQPKQPLQPTASATNSSTVGKPQDIPQAAQAQSKSEPATNREPNGKRPQSASPVRTGVSGLSIADLMRGAANTPQEDDESKVESNDIKIDPRSEEKINTVKERVIKDILEERPRFVVAFESMHIEGHRIEVEVPTSQLYEEIMRSKTEMLMQIAQTAGVNGMLELDVKINEQIKASRPIKLEDRIKFMTERNENILELKRLLDMDYE